MSNKSTFNNKPIVLIVGPMKPAVGGIATYIDDVLNSNLTNFFELIPFNISRPLYNGKKAPNSNNYGVIFNFSLSYLLKALYVTLLNIFKFPYVIVKKNPSLIHVHTAGYLSFFESSLYLFISALFNKKTILHIHANSLDTFYQSSSFLTKLYIRKSILISDKTIALSNYWKKFIVNEMKINNDLIYVIHNGVPFSKYAYQKTCNEKFDDNIHILFMGGRDSKRKGVYDLISSISLILNQQPNVILTVVGSGEVETIRSICKDLNLGKNVRILGQITDKEKINELNNSDIFVLPSYSEGLPISILEAMAFGVPVVSTTVGAIPEVIEEGVNGFLIEPGDHKLLAEKLLLLIKSKNLREDMGINNLEKIKNKYDLKFVTNELQKLYDNVNC